MIFSLVAPSRFLSNLLLKYFLLSIRLILFCIALSAGRIFVVFVLCLMSLIFLFPLVLLLRFSQMIGLRLLLFLNFLFLFVFYIMKFQTLYNLSPHVGITFTDKSMTRQEFVEESDIGTLVTRYTKTGSFYDPLHPPAGELRRPMFGDLTAMSDFLAVQSAIAQGQRDFDSLPSAVRARFGNSMQALVSWLSSPDNRAEAERMGFVFEGGKPSAAAPSQPVAAPVAPPVASDTPSAKPSQ